MKEGDRVILTKIGQKQFRAPHTGTILHIRPADEGHSIRFTVKHDGRKNPEVWAAHMWRKFHTPNAGTKPRRPLGSNRKDRQ